MSPLPHLTAPPATHFKVVVPAHTQAGRPAVGEVIALTASNHRAFGYTGTVQLSDTDTAAHLPATLRFSRFAHGARFFVFTPETGGSDTITATDTGTASITGQATTTVTAAVVTHFQVIGPSHAAVGGASRVTIVALDASNHRVWNYTGTVQLQSSDPAAQLPAQYQFTAQDHGRHTITVTFGTAGAQTLTARDSQDATITGSETTTVAPPAVATQLEVFAVPVARAGRSFQVVVVALDAAGHRVPNYRGTVTITSGDTIATLPGAYMFTASDRGRHAFVVALNSQGEQALTVKDDSSTPLTGTATVYVRAGRTGIGHPYWF